MDLGLELHGVQAPPDPLFFVIITGKLLLANRAGPEETLPMLKIDIHPLPPGVQGPSGYLPWRFQSQQLPVEICILHPKWAELQINSLLSLSNLCHYQ